MSTHDKIVEAFEAYCEENERFEEKGFKAGAVRTRKALSDLMKLAKERRAEISEEVEERSHKY